MRSWIFQARPDRYDLRKKIVPGKKAQWYVTRYRSEISPGDEVYFWLAGAPQIRGIYGAGKIVGHPYKQEDWDKYGVDIEYTKLFEPPVPASLIESHAELKDLLIIRAPFGTNFPLDEQQARILAGLARSRAA